MCMKRLVRGGRVADAGFAGYCWIWIDRDRLAWPDRWTHTRVVVLPKKKRWSKRGGVIVTTPLFGRERAA